MVDSNNKVFQLSLDLMKDTLFVVLNNRNEIAHFWFHEMLFKPFSTILMSGELDIVHEDKVSFCSFILSGKAYENVESSKCTDECTV